MIGYDYGKCYLFCDICGEIVKDFETFDDAVDYKANNGWIGQNNDGEWEDVCPDCQEEVRL